MPLDPKDPDVALLRELLNRRPIGPDPIDALNNPNLPPVPHPGGFRPDPLVVGTPRLGNDVNELFHLAPELRGRVNTISTAPTPSVMNSMMNAKMDPILSNQLNIIGLHTPKQQGFPTSEVWLRSDNTYPPGHSLKQTLTHEMGHAAGWKHGPPKDEATMDIINMLAAKIFGNR